MSRFSIVPGAVLAVSVLALSGCGGGVTASKASTTPATATTSTTTTDALSSAPSSTTKPAPTASPDSLAALAPADSQYVSYDNSDVAQSAAQVRGIDQVIESHPDSDPATDLATYRKAVTGCTSALIGDDGSRNTVRLVSAPSGYGSSALAFQLTGTSGGERSVVDFIAVASGKNVIALATGGFSAAQRARILAQTWKNLTSATSPDSAPSSSGGSI